MAESNLESVEAVEPWYSQFWPWFIFGLPASVVVAGFITLYIAIVNDDSLVADNYYKQGLSINQSFAQDTLAVALALKADIRIDQENGEMRLVLTSLEPQAASALQSTSLQLIWSHPISSDKDFTLDLKRNATGAFISQLPHSVSGRWYLQLLGTQPTDWRIKNEIDFSQLSEFSFSMEADR